MGSDTHSTGEEVGELLRKESDSLDSGEEPEAERDQVPSDSTGAPGRDSCEDREPEAAEGGVQEEGSDESLAPLAPSPIGTIVITIYEGVPYGVDFDGRMTGKIISRAIKFMRRAYMTHRRALAREKRNG
jgi:hypothetical protein